jgi:hypothetical protein
MRTMPESITNPQIDKARQVLVALAINVSTDDKQEAERETGLHPKTIREYLKGRGTDLDTATKLVQFFKRRIADRDRELAA